MTTKLTKICLIFLLVCTGFMASIIANTVQKLEQVSQRALKNQNDINAGQGLNIQLFQLEQRVENTENWIWNFEDIMFGPADPPSTNNVGE